MIIWWLECVFCWKSCSAAAVRYVIIPASVTLSFLWFPQIRFGLGPPGAAITQNPQRDGEHAAGPRHAHHHQVRMQTRNFFCKLLQTERKSILRGRCSALSHPLSSCLFVQEQGDEQRRVHLLLQAINEASDRTRPLLSAPQGEVWCLWELPFLNPVGINKSLYIHHDLVLVSYISDHFRLFLPLQPVSVETPQGGIYNGKRLSGKRVSLPSCFNVCLPLVAERVITPTCRGSDMVAESSTSGCHCGWKQLL